MAPQPESPSLLHMISVLQCALACCLYQILNMLRKYRHVQAQWISFPVWCIGMWTIQTVQEDPAAQELKKASVASCKCHNSPFEPDLPNWFAKLSCLCLPLPVYMALHLHLWTEDDKWFVSPWFFPAFFEHGLMIRWGLDSVWSIHIVLCHSCSIVSLYLCSRVPCQNLPKVKQALSTIPDASYEDIDRFPSARKPNIICIVWMCAVCTIPKCFLLCVYTWESADGHARYHLMRLLASQWVMLPWGGSYVQTVAERKKEVWGQRSIWSAMTRIFR